MSRKMLSAVITVHGKIHRRFVLCRDLLGSIWPSTSFQVHGVDASGRVVVAKAMRRNKLLEFFASLPARLVGREASGSGQHWARELMRLGHEARMMNISLVL